MTCCRSFVLAIACLVALSASAARSAPTTENVVFGNLGSTASGAVTPLSAAQVGSTVQGENGFSLAVGFTTGTNADFLKLTSVVIGLGDVTPYNDALLKLVADSSGNPSGSVLASKALSTGPNGKYTFDLGVVPLSAGTTYWVTLEAVDASAPNFFNWLNNTATVDASVQNGSGYSLAGGRSNDGTGGGWVNFAGGSKLAISVQAVPEPSTYALAAIGAGVAGLMSCRRRKVAVDAAATV